MPARGRASHDRTPRPLAVSRRCDLRRRSVAAGLFPRSPRGCAGTATTRARIFLRLRWRCSVVPDPLLGNRWRAAAHPRADAARYRRQIELLGARRDSVGARSYRDRYVRAGMRRPRPRNRFLSRVAFAASGGLTRGFGAPHLTRVHVRGGSVDPDAGFAMDWETYADKAKQLKAITDEAKKADRLILATDPDREGEAISWHVQEVLRNRKALPNEVERVTFNAITKATVTEAMQHPRQLDEDLIDAYRARRALDYLVGFTLSPVLWRKLPGAKSAGRVQSVALRLIVDREREIEAFVAQDYWSVAATLVQDGTPFIARLVKWNGDKFDRLTIGNEGDALKAKADVEAGRFPVQTVETQPATRNPPPPFTTSTLQQEAARKLGFSASHTMRIAQALYEDGAITYMRTDGVQMDGSAISAARHAITNRYDASYVPDKPRMYQTKAKNAQEAHEAIRPTDFSKDRAGSGDHARLYELIWKRAMASQMASGRMERTTIDLADGTGRHGLRATGQVVLFPGYLALYEEGSDDSADEESRRLPRMRDGDAPAKKSVTAAQHFPQPQPRISETTLVKRLGELGIGRPSTYASTIQVLKDRNYVRVEKNRFFAEESGRLVTAFLERFFEKYVSYDYTAGLEDELDEISGGRAQWQQVLEAFWRDFKPRTNEVMAFQPSEVTQALDQF